MKSIWNDKIMIEFRECPCWTGNDVTVLSVYLIVSRPPRTFCFPGVSGLHPVNTRQNHTGCPPWTQTVLSSPQSNIYHSRVQLRLALTATWRPWAQVNQWGCTQSTRPCCKLCPLLVECRNCCWLSLLRTSRSTPIWGTHHGSSWYD